MFIEHENPTELAKEIFYLAWKASNVAGMGFLQNNPSATKEDVWNNIVDEGDYPYRHPKVKQTSDIYANYVFGRMMKFGLTITKNGISIPACIPNSEYQSWCRTYPTIQTLVDKAIEIDTSVLKDC